MDWHSFYLLSGGLKYTHFGKQSAKKHLLITKTFSTKFSHGSMVRWIDISLYSFARGARVKSVVHKYESYSQVQVDNFIWRRSQYVFGIMLINWKNKIVINYAFILSQRVARLGPPLAVTTFDMKTSIHISRNWKLA